MYQWQETESIDIFRKLHGNKLIVVRKRDTRGDSAQFISQRMQL